MNTFDLISTIFETVAVISVIIGFIFEDKLVEFEKKVFNKNKN